ncbi:cytochrome-c oxidase [Halomonas sp. A29]|uniref:cytochrome-c oxidase n=1 Tax=Halomonas sp. A29 TaxID=3102786 RepID=UPI00398A6D31
MNGATADKKMALLWLKIAVVYLLIGVIYGIVMAASHQYVFRSVHAHINLLGWASLALAGLMYHLYPVAARSRLGRIHFYLHNGGLPVLLLTLHFYAGGMRQLEPLVAVASVVVGFGILAFAVNVMMNMKVVMTAGNIDSA